MNLVANQDGQVTVEAQNKWYIFQLTGECPLDELKAMVIEIMDGKVEPVSYNGDHRNYNVNGIYVSVIPPYVKSSKDKPEYLMFSETPEIYEKYVQPKVECPKWIKDIEVGTAEGELILSETKDYYLLPDFKWDRKASNLYLLVIFKDPTSTADARILCQSNIRMCT